MIYLNIKFRIWDQAEADQAKYGGELAPGSPVGRESYARLLLPILRVNQDIVSIYSLVREPDGSGLEKAQQLLNKSEFQKVAFKKIFNAFGKNLCIIYIPVYYLLHLLLFCSNYALDVLKADNIYYSDPDRANLYLAGGALPRNEQSLAYLLRNDILTNIEALQAEISFLLKEMTLEKSIPIDDLYRYSEEAKSGMLKYLELVSPIERQMAESLLRN